MQLQFIIDSSPHAIFIKDLQGRFLQINRAFEDVVRLPGEKIIGRTGEEILPPATVAVLQAMEAQALVNPKGVEFELADERDDGRHWYKVHKFPLRDAFGRIYAIFGFVTSITDRKRAEEALQVSEEKFRQLAENINEVFWITDPAKDRMEYVSPAYESIWGRSCASLLQSPKGWLDAIHPEDRQRVSEAAATKQKDGTYEEIYRIIRPEGSIRWIQDRAFPLKDAKGDVYRLVGIAADITELKRIQEELARREEQYRGVFTSVTEGLIIRDLDGTAVDANPAFCSLLGYSREEILRLRPDDYVEAGCLPAFRQFLETVRAGNSFRFQGHFRRKDGTLVSVDAYGATFHYDGRPHLLGSVRDVSAQKSAEDALRRSEADFRTIFQNAPFGMALVGPDGRPIRCNLALQKLLGFSESELQGMVFTEFTHPEDIQADLTNFRELIDGKRDQYQIEKRYLRKGGELVTALLTVSAAREHSGDAPHIIAMLEDVTEKRKLEEQVLRAQRIESVGMLAGGIAHDLNNILAPMLMAAGLLKGKLTEPRDQAIVTIIEQGAQRGAAIIRQLLTFSRGLEGERGDVQVRHLIKDMVDIVRETFPRNVEIEPKVPTDLWVVKGNATQLHQVLMNLCLNARDAMPKGGRLIITTQNVRLTEENANLNPLAKPGRFVVVKVADTGHGIPKEIMDRIFEPFFTTKAVGQGTGLGLSTVVGIVKNHGGSVTVYSEPGKGTEFKVYLPVADSSQAAAQAPVTAAPLGRGELVLLVDDEPAIREATKQVLEKSGYRVVTAANGADALRTFVQNRDAVRLVLTDMMMPVMGGAPLIRALRIIEPKVSIVAMSGLDEAISQEDLEALNFPEFVTKPCDAGQLLHALHRALTAG
ncbi:MAG TPA: PAS domain S-box protein [Opitutaceae bacterium]|nr:PAS domain S-box protein [Opitutaceae bacterium]